MADVKISQLPSGTANANAVVPATNASGTTTQKVTMGAIAALGGGPPAAHKATHATGGSDALSAADIGAAAASHNHAAGDINSGTLNIARIPTGTTSSTVCIGNDSRLSDARTPTAHKTSHATGGSDALTASDIGAADSSHTHDYDDLTNKPTLFSGDYEDLTNTPPVVVSDPTGITGADAITNIVSLTQAEYDNIVTPSSTTLYVITD